MELKSAKKDKEGIEPEGYGVVVDKVTKKIGLYYEDQFFNNKKDIAVVWVKGKKRYFHYNRLRPATEEELRKYINEGNYKKLGII